MKHIVKTILLIVNLLFCGLLISGAFSGLHPTRISVLVELFFPFSLLGCVIFIPIWLIHKYKFAAISIISMILSWGGISRYFPIHFSHPIDKSQPGFTLMTYNAYGFLNYEKEKSSRNRTIDFILSQDADIVCLQEGIELKVHKPLKITQEQIDSLFTRYPYRIYNNNLNLLSKYPAQLLHSDEYSLTSMMAIYQINMDGEIVNIANLHLESIGLTKTDKELYHDITQIPNTNQLDDIKAHLLSKLVNSAQARNRQADQIADQIADIPGTFIVCGDFNDTPLSYSVRLFQRMGFHSAYNELGSGPGITYHANRFWFRIDHILYRGNIDAIGLERPRLKTSDHYPLITQFEWDTPKKLSTQ